MKTVSGTSVLKKIAIGPLRWYGREAAPAGERSSLTAGAELARFEQARRGAQEQLREVHQRALSEAGEDAAIFEIHRMMLDDEDFLRTVRELIQAQGSTAEYAARMAGERFAAVFAAMDDPYMQARAADVRDAAGRVVSVLTGGEKKLPWDGPFLLMADDLPPSETMDLDRSRLLGFVTRRGSVNSHTAILARALGIPALVGAEVDPDWDGRPAVLDGWGQRLYVDPTPELCAVMEARRRAGAEQDARLQALRGKPSVTLDGTAVPVCANIGSVSEAEAALQNGAQGIGLFRSEFLYLNRPDLPTEEEQFAVYRRTAEIMAGRRVVIRTLDIGADKQAACLPLEREENPALGLRAIRLCLSRREVFKTQLRAILRASAWGNVAVMFPMIISVEEVRQARALLDACRAELTAQGYAVGPLEVGIMVETPAAVLIADALAQEVDFFSLGTNDLTQYALAVDRQNPRLAPFYDPRHPAVLEMIRMTAQAARRRGIWVGICGELGADLDLTETLLRMGVDELSVSPAAVLPLCEKIRGLDLRRE